MMHGQTKIKREDIRTITKLPLH